MVKRKEREVEQKSQFLSTFLIVCVLSLPCDLCVETYV
jgi:hypothetical protein